MQPARLYDTHTHSNNSPDGFNSVSEMCKKAYELGLFAFTITDHYEIPEWDTNKYDKAIFEGYDELLKMKSAYKNKLEILAGIELGGAKYNIEKSKQILAERDYDFVLNSLHGVPGNADYHKIDYHTFEFKDMLFNYFEELLDQCKLNLFDSLAHLDYPTRYIRLQGVDCSLKPYSDHIDAILKYLAENGKALEINTSGLFANFKQTLPGIDIVRRFKELNGEYITIGSDAHRTEHISCGFDEATDMLTATGFKYITYYKKRKPITVALS